MITLIPAMPAIMSISLRETIIVSMTLPNLPYLAPVIITTYGVMMLTKEWIRICTNHLTGAAVLIMSRIMGQIRLNPKPICQITPHSVQIATMLTMLLIAPILAFQVIAHPNGEAPYSKSIGQTMAINTGPMPPMVG
jgi:hypothetical protein